MVSVGYFCSLTNGDAICLKDLCGFFELNDIDAVTLGIPADGVSYGLSGGITFVFVHKIFVSTNCYGRLFFDRTGTEINKD